MTFELGVYSFGNTPRRPDGSLGSTSLAITNLMENIRLAEEVGLDFFGVGEHHTREIPVSSPTSIINAAAASTKHIRLGTAVTILSTDDPIRLYQQHATAAIISGGRVEITVGRGSSTDSFPLFGFELEDYDTLFASKLDLLLAVNDNERVTWDGPFRDRPLEDALVVPRPNEKLRIWLGTGGNPESSIRAGQLGLPVAYGILGGNAEHWARYGELYRKAGEAAGHAREDLDVYVASHGFVAQDSDSAKELYYKHESAAFSVAAKQRGFSVPTREHFYSSYAPGGMVFVGNPEEVADRIISFQKVLGHSRQILQLDVGGMPQREVQTAIALLGTEVLPRVRAELS